MSKDSNSETQVSVPSSNVPELPVRMKLVNTAAEFLMSPNVQSSSMDMKMSFLKKKGLTDKEIDLAIQQSDAKLMAIRDDTSRGTMLPGGSYPPGGFYPTVMDPPLSRWTVLRDVANVAILLGGLTYGAYWTYKNLVLPYFYGKSRRSLDDKMKDMERELSTCLVDVRTGLDKIRDDIEKMQDKSNKEISELKAEVTSLKKLLLNRKQFPTASGLTPLSIPSWQIPENEENKHQTSGTPEEEGNNSNGSESSLEMIKE